MMIMQPLVNVYTGTFSLAERIVPRVAATEPCRPYGRPFAAAKNCEFLDNSLERHDNRCRLMKLASLRCRTVYSLVGRPGLDSAGATSSSLLTMRSMCGSR